MHNNIMFKRAATAAATDYLKQVWWNSVFHQVSLNILERFFAVVLNFI